MIFYQFSGDGSPVVVFGLEKMLQKNLEQNSAFNKNILSKSIFIPTECITLYSEYGRNWITAVLSIRSGSIWQTLQGHLFLAIRYFKHKMLHVSVTSAKLLYEAKKLILLEEVLDKIIFLNTKGLIDHYQ